MRRIRSKNMKPEMIVRKLAHKLGYRCRLHRKDLPGKPDLVFAGRRKVIFVHGCFWHLHTCRDGRVPGSRQDYWGPKLRRNVARDADNQEQLQAQGWQVLTIWECETKDLDHLRAKLKEFLNSSD